jgi:chemotaxis signal transduction protein
VGGIAIVCAGTAAGPPTGLRVEAVREVCELATADAMPPPRAGGLFAARWLAGLAKVEAALVPVLALADVLDAAAARRALAAAEAATP